MLCKNHKIDSRELGLSCFIVMMGVAISGCAVGPHYHRPEPPAVTTYRASDPAQSSAAIPANEDRAVRFVPGQDIPSQWWMVFHSPAMDQLMRQALANSPTLELAQAKVREAQENYNASAGTVFYPSADLTAGAKRQKVSNTSLSEVGGKGNTFNVYQIGANIAYTLDIFGKGRRELESLRSEVDYQRFQLEAAHLTLTADIVASIGKEVALRGQIQVIRDIIASQDKQQTMLEKQFSIGGVSQADVLAARTRLEQTKASLPPLEKELAFTRHHLAALVGKFPSEAGQLPEFTFADLTLPQELPVSLPSVLVQQRPDICAAEALLHAASAKIGVATANLFPAITLSGSLGTQANLTKALFESNSSIWSLGSDLVQPIFKGGELRAKQRAAVAVYDQAAAHYRQTILSAFQSVADVLRALETDDVQIKALMAAEAAARVSYEVADKQFKAGAVSYLTLLNAEQQHQSTRIGVIQAQAVRFADTSTLFQVLGGGWWNRDQDVSLQIPADEGKINSEDISVKEKTR